MFRNAYALARQFTAPIIASQRQVSGKCSSSIGAFVVINSDGWIATAGHVLEQMAAMTSSMETCRERANREQAIRNDASIDEKERRARLKQLGRASADDIDRCSFYWGGLPNNPQTTQTAIVQGVDLGIAKLGPFDPSSIATYPVFKDPTKNFDPGTSLCKLGFPFHAITPTYHADRDAFELPAGALPVPFFPIEGLFTRTAMINLQGVDPDPAIPLQWVETSTPGLRGQSGGPTMDAKGRIWAIQSRTSHYPLNFDPKIPDQYFHVGLGVHPMTIFAVFDKLRIRYQKSAD